MKINSQLCVYFLDKTQGLFALLKSSVMMKLTFETVQDWTLAIKFVNVRDQGVYVCQVKSSEQ